MMTDELMVFNDYRDFAETYLGIDLEDYLELLDDYELTEDGLESVLTY